jgi:hypothetical protein
MENQVGPVEGRNDHKCSNCSLSCFLGSNTPNTVSFKRCQICDYDLCVKCSLLYKDDYKIFKLINSRAQSVCAGRGEECIMGQLDDPEHRKKYDKRQLIYKIQKYEAI